MRCPKCKGREISDDIRYFLEGRETLLKVVNRCYRCGYIFDRAEDGPEVQVIRLLTDVLPQRLYAYPI
jgi:predicted Zn-ribbon and HTH transcriptional regulator